MLEEYRQLSAALDKAGQAIVRTISKALDKEFHDNELSKREEVIGK